MSERRDFTQDERKWLPFVLAPIVLFALGAIALFLFFNAFKQVNDYRFPHQCGGSKHKEQ